MALALMVENVGVAPPESFTMFGLTSKRDTGNPLTIGMFGSGNKHAIIVLLRMGIKPVIYCGNLRLEFFLKRIIFKDKAANQVCVKVTGKDETGKQCNRTEELSVSIGYGAMDWDSVNMALREFVSNALDAQFEGESFTEETPRSELIKGVRRAVDNTTVEIVDYDDMRAKKGYTRVYIPLDNGGAVENFYKNIGKWFLHFSEPTAVCDKILRKNNRQFANGNQSACIYRRGVFVRQYATYDGSAESLFDYNFGSELKIDESRNCNDWDIRSAASTNIKNSDKITVAQYFRGLSQLNGRKVFESELSSSLGINPWDDDKNKQEGILNNWEGAFKLTYGENSVAVCEGTGSAMVAERIKGKGLHPVILPKVWYDAVKQNGGMTDDKALTQEERDGITYLPATVEAQAALDRLYEMVVTFNLHCGKTKPNIHCFQKVMDAESQLGGFWKRGTNDIYVHIDYAQQANSRLDKVILEELCHYLTEASDMSRDFQDWILRFAIEAVNHPVVP